MLDLFLIKATQQTLSLQFFIETFLGWMNSLAKLMFHSETLMCMRDQNPDGIHWNANLDKTRMTTEEKLRFCAAAKPLTSVKLMKLLFQVKVGFTVKASSKLGGSVSDLSKKNKGSFSSLKKVCRYNVLWMSNEVNLFLLPQMSGSVSGSLMSLGKKEKKRGIKNIVHSSKYRNDLKKRVNPASEKKYFSSCISESTKKPDNDVPKTSKKV